MATILTKRSNTAASVPLAAQLTNSSLGAELAVNTTDKRLYTKDGSGNVVEIGTNPSALSLPNGTANGVAYLNGSKVLTTGSGLVFDGTNLGLGVTPSGWNSGYKVAEIGKSGSSVFAGTSSGNVIVASNAYLNASDAWTYANNGGAAYFGVRNSDRSFVWNISSTGSGTAGNAISFTQAMTLDSSCNLGLGVTPSAGLATANYRLFEIGLDGGGSVYSGSNQTLLGTNIAWAGGTPKYKVTGYAPTLYNQQNGVHSWSTSASGSAGNAISFTQAMTLTSGGDLLVGGTSNYGFRFQAEASSGQSAAYFYRATATATDNLITGSSNVGSAGSTRFVVLASGNVQNTNNSYGAISDAKLKENVTDATPKLEKLNQVRIVNFNMIGDTQKQIGVIAQELEQIFPGMIDESPDRDAEGNDLGTTTKSVKYSVFVPMLVKAIQELNAKVEALEARLASDGASSEA